MSNIEIESSLYRILSFDRVVEIFQRGELYFSHPSNWDDPYEIVLKHKYWDSFFAQCWCENGVSDAMWRIYSPNQLGVRIRITKDRLQEQLSAASGKQGINFIIGEVDYLAQSKLQSKLRRTAERLRVRFNSKLAAESLLMKRDAFSHESEVRVVVYPKHLRRSPIPARGFKVSVDPYYLIRGVLVDPRAPEAYVEAYKHYLRAKLGFRGNVLRSLLYSGPEPLKA